MTESRNHTPPWPAPVSAVQVHRWRDGALSVVADQVAEEVPVTLSYQGIAFVVMMASPADLEDLGVGLTLTEGLALQPADITAVELHAGASLEVRVALTAERFAEFLKQRRNLTGRTGCGVCGAQSIDQVIHPPAPVGAGIVLARAQLHAALASLQAHQAWNAETGSIHAAAWALPDRGIQVMREDVGRHNALDKVIGALVRAQQNAVPGYFLLTSRASYEMVQKAAIAGASVVVAVSAPTAMAIRLAERCGMTLVGFARAQQHVVYTHPQRIID